MNEPAKTAGPQIHIRAPRDGVDLLNFSQHIFSWLPTGTWKLIQLDNSNNWSEQQAVIFNQILADSMCAPDYTIASYLFEHGYSLHERFKLDVRLSFLVYLILLFEGHGAIVGDGARSAKILSLQDGFAYFLSDDTDDLNRAASIIVSFERAPRRLADWVIKGDIFARS